jgi:hypothetical protein
VRGHSDRCRRRRRPVTLLVVGVLVGIAGCGRSAADVDRVARSVPAPPGLTFTGVLDQSNPSGIGANSHEADASYTNPPMPCSQLLAEWMSTLKAAHWKIDTNASTFGAIVVKRSGYNIIVNLHDITTCDHSTVSVQS